MIIASLYNCPFDSQLAHDMSASIIKDGYIYAYEEEKFTTTKNESTVKFPERSLMMGCKELNIIPSQVDEWVLPTPYKKIPIEDYYQFFAEVIKAFCDNQENFEVWFKEHVYFVDHHQSHAGLAVLASPFKECAYITKDGGGDLGDPRGFTFGEFKNNEFNLIKSRLSYDNLSVFHDYLTDATGFGYFENGKTSGLAAYGEIKPKLSEKFREVLTIIDDGINFERKRYSKTSVNLNKVYPSEYNRYKIFRQSLGDTNIYRMCKEYLFHDIAATGEFVLYTTFLELLKNLKNETSLNKLVCSGGLFQNVALNNKILESKIFDDVYFPMAASDAGLSLGAALYIENKLKPGCRKRNIELTPFLGPSYKKNEIRELLDRFRLNYVEEDDISKKAAELIADGNVVGWFQNKGEYGPRSLGNRSILADPRKENSKSRINQLLKKREWFMPYAPSILEEHVDDWAEISHASPYMQIAFKIKEDKKQLIPAAVHVDDSTRIHTVNRLINKRYWNLIENFREITGIPVVLNTSFNRHRIATISTPRQAIEHLLEGSMDFLAIDDFLVDFSKNRLVSKVEQFEKSEKLHLAEDCIKRLESVFSKGSKEEVEFYLEQLSGLLQLKITYENKLIVIENEKISSISEVITNLLNIVRNSQ